MRRYGVEVESQKIRDLETLAKLTRILKHGLYAILEIIYIFWVGATFALSGWLAGLLAILCIAAVHPLRWLWDDSADVNITADTDSRVTAFKKKLEYFFASTAILCDIALVAIVSLTLPQFYWIVGIVVSVAATEAIHLKIRFVNKDLAALHEEITKEYEKTKEPVSPLPPLDKEAPTS